MTQDETQQQWWRDAVIYQIYPRSWADSDGDGMGDLPGITSRLDHLAALGVDAVWISPFYTSPQNDAGYDVADYRDIDPRFGTLADADALLERAHELGLRVLFDLVPNHSSSEHPWFQAALAAPPGSPERARYVFREGAGENGELPPNNWRSNFGGPAWTRVTEADGSPGQWYLHLFDTTQPDFDWTNPEVGDEMESVIRFWLDRGADGFRIDVAHGLVKVPGLPDAPEDAGDTTMERTSELPMWDQPGVHDIYRRWRKVTDSYAVDGEDADRILCAEAWVWPTDALAQYVRPDELHQSFNFGFLMSPWIASALRTEITASLEAVEAIGAPQTWVLSNHDVVRHASRLGFDPVAGRLQMGGIGVDDPQPDREAGLRRARAATTLMLALPGSAYLYQGEELGTARGDRAARRGPAGSDLGEVGWRGPWSRRLPGPDPVGRGRAVVRLRADGEVLAAAACVVRRARGGPADRRGRFDARAATGSCCACVASTASVVVGCPGSTWGTSVLAFDVTSESGAPVRVIANLGAEVLPLPEGEVLVASGELDADGGLPTDCAVWLRLS